MITLKEFLEAVNYRITEGSAYQWQCYGPNAYSLDSWNGEHNGYSFSIIFDTVTQEIYQAQAHDYSRCRAYRIFNPAFKTQFQEECQQRNVVDCAWEEDDGSPINYTELEVASDFVAKALAIVAGEEYDTRVTVPLNLSDDELFRLMKLAHERDITLNALVAEIMQLAIDQEKYD
jgi:hypothetical protein